MKYLALFVLAAASIALAQAPAPPVKPASAPTAAVAGQAPVLSLDLKYRVLKARAAAADAQLALERSPAYATAQEKGAAFGAVVQELQKACGDHFTPQINDAGDPACVAKPAPAPMPPAPAKPLKG